MKSFQEKYNHLLFIIVFFIVLLIPFVCMPFAFTERLSGGTEPVKEPSIILEDGSLNINIFEDCGKYFEYHFAFRSQFVTANSLLRKLLFNESGTDQVILGRDGFMFYSGTLDDYFGKDELSDFELNVIANNLKIIQDNLTKRGKRFCFVVAPNKNSLYPQFMPYNYIETNNLHNFSRLTSYLDLLKINYLNVFEIFNNLDEIVYLKEDSHWNNFGALIVSNKLFNFFNKNNIYDIEWLNRNDKDGDLFIMEFPSIVGEEEERYAPGYNDCNNLTGENWSYTIGDSYEDVVSLTKSNMQNSKGLLYMFRDSFANSMIPYLSSGYNRVTYSKLVPYDIEAAIDYDSDDVIIERAERNLKSLIFMPPIMKAPELDIPSFVNKSDNSDYSSDLSITVDGDYVLLSGTVNDVLEESIRTSSNARIIIKYTHDNESNYFLPFGYIDKDNGKFSFCARLILEESEYNFQNFSIYLEDNGKFLPISNYNILE